MLRNALGELALDDTLQDILSESQAQSLQLAALMTELGQKVEPGQSINVGNFPAIQPISAVALPLPAGAATEATLAARATEATLSALSGAIGTPSSDDMLSLLRDIKTNTGQEVAAVQALELTADQVNLNTDAVESLLGTTNARIGTTGVAGSVAALLDAIRIAQGDGSQRVGGTIAATQSGAWTVGVNNFPSSQAVTGPLTDAQLAARLPLGVSDSTAQGKLDTLIGQLPTALSSGRLKTEVSPASGSIFLVERATVTSATLANVASSASSVQLWASNASAKLRTIFNDSTAVLYVKLGTTASATDYTVKIAAGGYYELPNPTYTGRVDGIWASANGNARLTEA